MRHAFRFTVILLQLLLAGAYNSFAQKPFALVELFTSEGCSTCPPADELLSTVKKDAMKSGKNVITLAYHVDYWNKFGWKDPYSKMQFTLRQENYSRVVPEKEMYTPQAIINGRASFTGSKKSEMKDNIEKALQTTPDFSLILHVDSTVNDTLYITYDFTKHSKDFTLRFVLTEDGLTSHITGGENAGKTITHDSVVRYLYSVDSPPVRGNFKLPLNVFTGTGTRNLVAFVQKKITMNVLAATQVKL
jgi:hypothetical protein